MRRFTNICVPEELRGANVFLKDRLQVENLLCSIFTDGAKRLHIVTDFDFTLTKHNLENEETTLSSFELFERCPSVPANYKAKTLQFRRFYKVMEMEPSISKKDKFEYMREWWSKTSEITRGFPFYEKELLNVAKNHISCFKDNIDETFKALFYKNIPCLIFSAGLGNSVVALLKAANINYPNVKVISNFFEIKDGCVNGFKGNLIHAMNKNEIILKITYFEKLKKRDNVILMGDNLGDAGVLYGINFKNILKIGFLSSNNQKLLYEFLNVYDIVLVEHNSMAVPNAIIYRCH